jgi:hypothetical protein
MGIIEKQIATQQRQKGKHLIETNLVILGSGTKVTLGSDNLFALLDRRTAVTSTSAVPTPIPVPSGGNVGPAPTASQHGGPNNDWFTDVKYGSNSQPLAKPLVVNAPQDWSVDNGSGSISVVSNDSVDVNTTLKVTDVNSKQGHGQISIDSRKTSGAAITLSNSGQLLALLNATSHQGGTITFTSAGGDVNVNGGTIQADHGTVDLRNNGASGVVNLTNATIHGDVVKIGALGNNGTLNIGGGTIGADSTIKLYAGGSNGTVNFIENVTLSGNSAKTIAGDTVTIFNGKTVTVLGNGPAEVFTNNPNYSGFGGNATTTGTFAGQGAATHSLSGAPGY